MNKDAPLTSGQFARLFDVSRETMERLSVFETALKRWQKKINLVGPASLPDIWRRHFLDSAQLYVQLQGATQFVDFGSGAGFPGLVMSIMADCPGILIESDVRKAVFLREAARLTGARVKILNRRIETTMPVRVDIVTARALAPLEELLCLSEPWCRTGAVCLFLKGASLEEELTDAAKNWNIKYEKIESLSDPAAATLRITEFSHVGQSRPQ